MAQQSLYRRYRPRRFEEIRGQSHVTRSLRNAVAGATAGQAYLFSGPRGTGKTSTARILAKALNCTDLREGEPCCECESCVAIAAGASYDLFELDAASNNGVDAMRELVGRAAVGSPGRTKVYILDEVHMLTAASSNALLKTLEEPPDHVTFVLATTDPQKVLPTIRSRTQHFEFSLLTAAELEEYVRWVVTDAGLDVDDESIAHVVRVGRGSARDTLSALDQVVAAGGVIGRAGAHPGLVAAVADSDTARAIVAVDEAVNEGHDPRVVAESLLGSFRDAFLATVGSTSSHLSGEDATAASELGRTMGAARLTRAMEAIGGAMLEMRQAADPRVPLEVALVRLTDASADSSAPALLERIERLERSVSKGTQPASAPSSKSATVTGPSAPAPGDAARAQLSATPPPPPPPRPNRPDPPPPAAPAPVAAPEPAPTTETKADAAFPSIEELSTAMADGVLARLKGVAKAIYSAGRFVSVDGGTAVFALANAPTRDRAEKVRADVEAALATQFGRPIPLRLVDDSEAALPVPAPSPATASSDDEPVDVTELTDATDVATSGVEKLAQAFPGAVLVEEET